MFPLLFSALSNEVSPTESENAHLIGTVVGVTVLTLLMIILIVDSPALYRSLVFLYANVHSVTYVRHKSNNQTKYDIDAYHNDYDREFVADSDVMDSLGSNYRLLDEYSMIEDNE